MPPKLEALRTEWLHTADSAKLKAIATDIQRPAFNDVPCMPVGLHYQPVAYRRSLTDMQKGLILFTEVKRV